MNLSCTCTQPRVSVLRVYGCGAPLSMYASKMSSYAKALSWYFANVHD